MPIDEVRMTIASVLFTLIPYMFIKSLSRYSESMQAITSAEPAGNGTKDGHVLIPFCVEPIGVHGAILDVIVPLILLSYQVLVTYRRERSMRIDVLSPQRLKGQSMQLKIEKQKCEDMLLSMLPRQIIETLKINEPVEPKLLMMSQ